MTDRDAKLLDLGRRLLDLNKRVNAGIEVIHLEQMLGADGLLDGSTLMFRTQASALIGVAEDLNRQAQILMDVADLVDNA